MAAVSAPHASTALTPPSSSDGPQAPWEFAVPNHPEPKPDTYSHKQQQSSSSQLSNNQKTRPNPSKRTDTFSSIRSSEFNHLAPAQNITRKDSSISDTGSAPDSLIDMYGTRSAMNSMDLGERGDINGENKTEAENPDSSRWIHRDKLARIENEELQAAGIILPRSQTASRSSKRDKSRDGKSEHEQRRKRLGSIGATEEEEPIDNAQWDFRLPDEAAQTEEDYEEAHIDVSFADMSGGIKGISRIPVATTSPHPIPLQNLERDTPIRRSPSAVWGGEDEQLSYPKTRGRSQSFKQLSEPAATPTPAKRQPVENSPTKRPPTTRKGSNTNRTPSTQRPKTRSGPTREVSGHRPTTSSGTVKRPEGDPPWLATMYKPDPSLPPDQQLIPTVAKRLQQEQWEREGKFGTVYDTQFRPLNNDTIPQPPEKLTLQVPETGATGPESEAEEGKPEDENSAWPLRSPRSPAMHTSRPGTASGTYSMMPKISSTPQGSNPNPVLQPPNITSPERPTEEKGGCGCCAVM